MLRENSCTMVTIDDVEVGQDSSTGDSVNIRVGDGAWEWCPLSQVSKLTRTDGHKFDSITVAEWLALKRGWI